MKTSPKFSISAVGVSESRVQQFLDDYLKGRWNIGATEKIFRHFSAYEESEAADVDAAIGFNVILRKGPLVEESDWAPMRGWDFAVAEERHLLGKLESAMADCTQSSGKIEPGDIRPLPEDLLRSAAQLSHRLSVDEYAPTLIVVATPLDIDTIVEIKQQIDTPEWELPDDLRTNWILGRHNGQIWLYVHGAHQPRLYAVDVSAFARLRQLAPPADLVVEEVPLAAAVKRGILDAHDRVHLRLYQSYEFAMRDCGAVWAANIRPLDSTNGSV